MDGSAGQNTQALLYGTGGTTDTGSSSGSKPSITEILMPEWEWFKANVDYPNGAKAIVTDVQTRRYFQIVKQSSGNHLDVEPATAEDTAVMVQIYGGKINYVRRPVWVTIGNYTYAGSMYGVAHGANTVTNNNFNGQFCIHMLNSKNHVAGEVDKDHQAAVKAAYNAKP